MSDDDVQPAGTGTSTPAPEVPAEPTRADAPALPNLAQRVVQVFVSPGRLFDALRERPAWLGALVLVVAIALLTTFLVPQDLMHEAVRQQLAKNPNVKPEQMQKAMAMSRILPIFGVMIFLPVATVVISGVLFLIYEMGMGGEAGFKPVLSATSHAFLIPVIGGLLTLPIITKARDLQANLALDLVVPGLDPSSYAYHFMHGLDIFGLWGAAILGLAMSRIYPKRSAGASIALVLGLYIVYKAVTAAFGR